MRLRLSFRLPDGTIEIETGFQPSLRECLKSVAYEIQRLDDCILKRILQNQFIALLTNKIQEEVK